MITTKHTSGPWIYVPYEFNTEPGEEQCGSITTDTGIFIAALEGDAGTDEEVQANAFLIVTGKR